MTTARQTALRIESVRREIASVSAFKTRSAKKHVKSLKKMLAEIESGPPAPMTIFST